MRGMTDSDGCLTSLRQKVFFAGVSVGSNFCSVPKHRAHSVIISMLCHNMFAKARVAQSYRLIAERILNLTHPINSGNCQNTAPAFM